MKKLSFSFLLTLGLLTTIFFACKEDDPEGPNAPSISSISPTSGMVGDTVTINGSNFGTNPSVTVGDQTATIVGTASATSIQAQVPQLNPDAYDVEVTAGGETVTASTQFTVTEEGGGGPAEKTITSSPEGTGTVTWDADTTYILDGFVFVNEGQTLTIEPGTVIKGSPGTGADASALIVARGGMIMAEGTAEAPIIFTALEDDVEDPNDLQPTQRGLWGGLIVLGNASINDPAGESAVEGIPTSETRGLYGGTDDVENSGVLKYISIRHGGSDIGANNEINGLTLGGVGSGTTIEHIEIFANADDGIEFFGGTANVKYVIAAYCGDDAIDWDQGYSGSVQYYLTLQSEDDAGYGFESNGVVNDAAYPYDAEPMSIPTIANGTFIGSYTDDEAVRLRQGSGGKFYNSIFYNWALGVVIDPVSAEEPVESETRLDAGDIVFQSNLFGQIKTADGAAATDLAGVASASGGIATKVTEALIAGNNVFSDEAPFQAFTIPSGNTSIQPDGAFSPLLAADGPASQVSPATVEGLDAVDFIGAFGTDNWASGWTALSAYGFFAE